MRSRTNRLSRRKPQTAGLEIVAEISTEEREALLQGLRAPQAPQGSGRRGVKGGVTMQTRKGGAHPPKRTVSRGGAVATTAAAAAAVTTRARSRSSPLLLQAKRLNDEARGFLRRKEAAEAAIVRLSSHTLG